ncbi:unnamed protein product [Phaeothamnion confervicola]
MFNPRGLDASYVRRGAAEWWEFMVSPVDDARKGWTAWYAAESERDYNLLRRKKLQAFVRRCRFLLVAWGFLQVFHESVDSGPVVAWLALICLGTVVIAVIFAQMLSSASRRRHSKPFAKDQTRKWVRMFEMMLLLVALLLVVAAIVMDVATVGQIFKAMAAFLFTLYFVVQVLLLFVPDCIRNVAAVRGTLRVAHVLLGGLMLAPVLLLSFLPFMKDLQITLNFNEDFSKRFNIAGIFVTENDRRSITKKTH